MTAPHELTRPRIAVVGMSAIMPDAIDIDAFWRNIAAGVNCVKEVPATHWLASDHFDPDPYAPDKTYSHRGAFLDAVDFDPMAFGVPPTILPATDPAQLLALIAARELLEDVTGGDYAHLDLERTAIVLGTSSTTQLAMMLAARSTRPVWRKALREAGLAEPKVEEVCERIAAHMAVWQESSFPGLLGNIVAGRIANRFNLGGMNCITDAACASSLAALSTALGELYLHNADMVVTGGIDILNNPMMYLCFSKTPAMSPTGDCRPFSADADGTIMGEGIAMFALKRLEDAERDGNRIYAIIAGLGASSDGTAKSVYAPVATGQARALRRAYQAAGYDPSDVGLIEAHGTATRVGDQVEIEALRSVFADDRTRYCALGSVKSQIGHTKAAAGAAGLAKAILSLHGKALPPTINAQHANESLDLDRSAFYVNTELRPWITNGAPRRASVSSFGFGGANYHVTLEEYHGAGAGGRPISALPERLLLFGAPSGAEIVEQVLRIDRIRAERGFATAVCASLDDFDAGATCRLALVATPTAAEEALAAVVERIGADPSAAFAVPGEVRYSAAPARPGALAFLFPGQGSQYVGMGGSIALAFGEARAVWDAHAARGLHDAVFAPPSGDPAVRTGSIRRLTATDVAQPALALVSLGTLAALSAAGVRCDMVAGHSFGELPALYAARAFDQATLLDLAAARGAAMAATDGAGGAMLAVEASDDECATLLADWSGRVFLANHNAPGQVSVSGRREDIDAFAAELAKHSIRAVPLPVGAAFHSPLVAPAAEAFGAALATAKVVGPEVAAFSNLDGAAFPSDPDEVRARLAGQVVAPVRFADTVESMYARGARLFVEVGPGSVLTGLVGRVLFDRPHLAVTTAPKGPPSARPFLATLGALAVEGAALDVCRLRAWDESTRPRRPKSAISVPVDSVPLGRKYPPPDGEAGLPAPRYEAEPVAPEQAPEAVTPAGGFTTSSPGGFAAIDTAAGDLLREVHERSALLHQQYLQAITETHSAFLDVAGRAIGQVGVAGPTAGAALPRVPLTAPPSVPALTQPVPTPLGASDSAEAVEPAEVAEPVATEAVPMDPVDMVEEILAVVAEKTGYPRELLTLDMELEAGLGIDSIKRMEIFAALRERHPALESVDVSLVGEVRTFNDVVALIESATTPDDATTVAGGTVPAASRSAVSLAPAAPPGTPTPGLDSGIAVVAVGEPAAVDADELAAALTASGRPASTSDCGAVGERTAVVLALPVADTAEAGVEAAVASLDAVRAIAARGTERTLVLVETTANPWSAGFSGLARTIALEWPAACVRHIGVSGADVTDRVRDEVCAGGDTPVVLLGGDGTRSLPEPVEEAIRAGADPLEDGDVVIVSGGGRGVTAAVLGELAAGHRLRFLLLGRTTLAEEPTALAGAESDADLKRRLAELAAADDRSVDLRAIGDQASAVLHARAVRTTMAKLERAGSEVRYAAVDTRDAAAVTAAVEGVRTDWGSPAAVIHGAGVTADKRIVDKTDDQARSVLATKLVGLDSLLRATAGDPLKVIALFSSVVARSGNAGQADYAIANEVLNAVARAEQAARTASGCVVKSIGWGPWDGGLVTEGIAAQFRARNIGLLRADEAARRFVAELADGCDGTADPLIVAVAPA